jgi:hypothetical protein
LTEAILAVRDDALEIGVPSERFWSMTYSEVVGELNAFYRRRNADVREQKRLRAMMDYKLAQLIGAAFTKDRFPKTLQDAYPDMFPASSSGWRENKAQWQKYAAEFNRQRKVRGG